MYLWLGKVRYGSLNPEPSPILGKGHDAITENHMHLNFGREANTMKIAKNVNIWSIQELFNQ